LDTKEEVDAMYAKAIELGASDDGEPGQRAGAFYGAYVYDLDGNKLTFFNFDV
jgi:predicted lactoylglutathione lyase